MSFSSSLPQNGTALILNTTLSLCLLVPWVCSLCRGEKHALVFQNASIQAEQLLIQIPLLRISFSSAACLSEVSQWLHRYIWEHCKKAKIISFSMWCYKKNAEQELNLKGDTYSELPPTRGKFHGSKQVFFPYWIFLTKKKIRLKFMGLYSDTSRESSLYGRIFLQSDLKSIWIKM